MSEPLPITGRTRLVGVMGWPVSHSKSPAMQNAGLRAAGIDGVYVAMAVEPSRLGEAVQGLRALGFVGCNVTIPHKAAAMEFMDLLTPAARLAGAVNTIRVEADGSLTGHNTDCEGAVRAVESDGTTIRGRTVAILGAGGAARGAAAGCALAGAARVIVLNRTVAKAREIVDQLRAAGATLGNVACEAHELEDLGRRTTIDWSAVDVVMQMTSVGMNSMGPMPMDAGLLAPHCHIFESIYSPPETTFLARCRSMGLRSTEGLSMLLEQGIASFEFWFETKPDRKAMREALGKQD